MNRHRWHTEFPAGAGRQSWECMPVPEARRPGVVRRLWARIMHVVWATPEEAERYSRVDDELRRMGQ